MHIPEANHLTIQFRAAFRKITLGKNSNDTLFFQCERTSQQIDQSIQSIFDNAVKGNAHKDLNPDQAALCGPNQSTGHCGNKRGALAECKCETLDRNSNPLIRHIFENKVLNQLFDILDTQDPRNFHIKLACFASGYLLGEEILLFRFIDQLRENHYEGIIELYFIDTTYAAPIANASIQRGSTFEKATGNTAYIQQFIDDISKSLPPTITMRGTFFASSQDYINRASKNPKFKHHLIIGQDIENLKPVVGKIDKEAGLLNAPPIVLIKSNDTPVMCTTRTNNDTDLTACWVVNPSTESNNKWMIIAFIIAGAVATGMLYAASRQRRR